MMRALPAPKYPPGCVVSFRQRRRSRRPLTGEVVRMLPERPWPLLVRVAAATYVVPEERVIA